MEPVDYPPKVQELQSEIESKCELIFLILLLILTVYVKKLSHAISVTNNVAKLAIFFLSDDDATL